MDDSKNQSSRFDYVRYDDQAARKQAHFKELLAGLEREVVDSLKAGRPQSLVLTKLEEAYMWIGKAIRDEQVARQGDATDQPHRGE